MRVRSAEESVGPQSVVVFPCFPRLSVSKFLPALDDGVDVDIFLSQHSESGQPLLGQQPDGVAEPAQTNVLGG